MMSLYDRCIQPKILNKLLGAGTKLYMAEYILTHLTVLIWLRPHRSSYNHNKHSNFGQSYRETLYYLHEEIQIKFA